MSTAIEQTGYTCQRCGGPRTDDSFGSYCSETCLFRAKGRKVLDQLESDHSECSTCFRHVFHPQPRVQNGRTTSLPPTAVDAIEEVTHEQYPPRTHRYRAGCECGSVNPNHRHRILQNVDDEATRKAFVGALYRLAEKGAINGHPDPEAFKSAYRNGVDSWAELAGRSVYADE